MFLREAMGSLESLTPLHGSSPGKVKTISNLVIHTLKATTLLECEWVISVVFLLGSQPEILPFFFGLRVEWTFSKKIILKNYFTKVLASQGKGAIYFQKMKKEKLGDPSVTSS